MRKESRLGTSVMAIALLVALGAYAVDVNVNFATGEGTNGWTISANDYASPDYTNAVDQISLSYAGQDTAGSATVYAAEAQGDTGQQIATISAASSSATFSFPDTTSFRVFRIVTERGMALQSFFAKVSEATLKSPSGVTFSNNVTGTSFDAYWNAVEGATGYKVYVWTNAVVGASSGTTLWQETMPGATNASSSTKLTDAKFNACFTNPGWTRSDKAGYPTGEDGTIRIGTSGDNGWFQTPQIGHDAEGMDAEGMAVRFWAKANATNTKSMDIAVERVSGDTVTFAGTATLTTDMQEFMIQLPEWESGDCLRFNSITNGDRRTVFGTVTVVSGYSEGDEEPAYIVNGLDVGNVAEYSFSGLPSVPVSFAVEAYGRRGVLSSKTEAVVVDLANPDKVAVLNACPISSLASSAHTYTQNFDSLAAITVMTGDKEWMNGTTLEYWQAYKGADAVTSFNYNGGAGTIGGVYALSANRGDTVRALGAYSTKDNEFSFGIAFTNDTDKTILLPNLTYFAQQWGFKNDTNQTLSVSALVTNRLDWISSFEDGWTELGSTQSAVYGEGVAHDTPASTPVEIVPPLEIPVAPGNVLMLKWTIHSLKSGKPGMMGIDDVSILFTIKPEALQIRIR